MKRVIPTAAAGLVLGFGAVGCGGTSTPPVTTVTAPTTSASASPTTTNSSADSGDIKWTTPAYNSSTVAPVRWTIKPRHPFWHKWLLGIAVVVGAFLVGSLIGKWISRTSENAEHSRAQGYREWVAQHHDADDDD